MNIWFKITITLVVLLVIWAQYWKEVDAPDWAENVAGTGMITTIVTFLIGIWVL